MTQGNGPPPVSRFPNMPSKTAGWDETWAYLSSAIDYVLTDTGAGLSFTDCANITVVVFNYGMSYKPEGPMMMADPPHPHPVPTEPPLCSHLSDRLVHHVQGLQEKSRTLQDVDLLQYYAAEWDRYTVSTKRLNYLFDFLNRYWVKPRRDEGRKHVHQVGTLALVQWKAHFFSHIQLENSKLTNAVLRLIAQQRNGELIDQALVKKVVDSFVSLGLDDCNPNKECLDVYREQFENAFLQATENYYQAESDAFLVENSMSSYLKKVEERLKQEEMRVEHYLHATTRGDLIDKCEDILIRAHSRLMEESFQSLLDSEEDEDLQRIYALLSRIPEGIEPLHKRFESHVKQAGLTAISKLVGEASADPDSIDPKTYVGALLEVHTKYSEIVQRNFQGEAGFVAGVDKACREFVNRNAVTGTSSTKSAELFAKRVDVLLHESNKMAEDDFEGVLNHTIIVLEYLEGKESIRNLISAHK